MLLRASLAVLFLVTFFIYGGERKNSSSLPLKEVYLYSSGVGAYLHEGRFSGEKLYSFRFRKKALNDVLKSLFILGSKGVRFQRISYPSNIPLSSLLEGYRVPVKDLDSFSSLLRNMKGELFRGTLLDGSAFSGRLLAVEERKLNGPGQNVLKKEFLTFLTEKGIRRTALDEIRELRPADEKLFAELKESLALYAEARSLDARDLSISLQGGKNSLANIAYVIENPVWKTSYRLQLPEKSKKGFLQAWAHVENPTASDWKGVKLHLVSGKPVSFIEDLYTSYIPSRPVREKKKEAKLASVEKKALDLLTANFASAATGAAPSFKRRAFMRQSLSSPVVSASGSAGDNASSGKMGALFRYTVPAPVTLEKRKSAMLELFSRELPAKEYTLYAPQRENDCFFAAHFVNSTSYLLPAGPVTIYSGSGYGGDGSIPDLPAGKDVLLSFAKDLEVKAFRESRYPSGNGVLMTAKLANGLLTLQIKELKETLYTLENFSKKEHKDLILEHEKEIKHTLLTKPLSKTIGEEKNNIVQYLITLAPGKKIRFPVKEEHVRSRFYSLVNTGNIDPSLFRLYAGNGAQVPAGFKKFLQTLSSKNSSVKDCRRSLESDKRNLQIQERNYERYRKTLDSRISENYRNTLNSRLGTLDKKIQLLQEKVEKGEENLKTLQKDLADFLQKASF